MEISIRKTIRLGLVLLAVSACQKAQQDEFPYQPRSSAGKMLVDNGVGIVYRDTSFLLAPGVEETDMNLQLNDGSRQTIYIISADLNHPGVSLRTMVPAKSGKTWNKKTPRKLAQEFTRARERVVATTNGDYWNTKGTIPKGPVRMGWEVFTDSFNDDESDPQQALGYVGVNLNDRLVIGERARYASVKNSLKDCTGCGVLMVVNGQIRLTEWTARQPRTAIGTTADGKVYMLVCDGRRRDQNRNRWDAQGLSYANMSYIFKGLGCKNAACLDGGGSSQLIIRDPVTRNWQLRNRPVEEGGGERPVINAWAVTVDEP